MCLVAFSRTVVTFLYTLATMKTYIPRAYICAVDIAQECLLNIVQIIYEAYTLSATV